MISTDVGTAGGLPTLSVVIPVYNEQDWIERCVQAVRRAAHRAHWPVEVVVVDDGSTDGTPAVLERLVREGVQVVTQPNSGRFAARRAGLDRASGDRVLLVDSRVLADEDSLVQLASQVLSHPERQVWNGHVVVDTRDNVYAGFWAGLVKVAWRRYTARPRLTSFGAEDFDHYPKGAGFLSAPRSLLLEAMSAFRSAYEDETLSSDDTRMLRWVAQRERFWITPELNCTYHGRTDLPGFLRHSRFRGTTFVDGYLGTAGPTRRAAGVLALLVGLLGVTAARRPKTAAALVLTTPLAAGQAVRMCGAPPSEVRSVTVLLPAFSIAFGSGVLRGLRLSATAALRRRRRA